MMLRAIRNASASSAGVARLFSSNTSPSVATSSNTTGAPIQLTWKVLRTRSNELPVYKDIKNSAVITVVRKIEGNRKDLHQQIQSMFGPSHRVDLRESGQITVAGNHVKKIKDWLSKLGH